MKPFKELLAVTLVFLFLYGALCFLTWAGFITVPAGEGLGGERPAAGSPSWFREESNGAKEAPGTLANVIKEALLKVEGAIDISSFPESSSSDQVFAAVNKVVRENPEILFYNGCKYWSDGRLQLDYGMERQEALYCLQVLRQKADDIIARIIKPGMSDFEKQLAVHDYLVKNTRYATGGAERKEISPEASSAYGILVLGEGVCEGYAKALKLLLDRLGVECIYITGFAGGEGHAWNIIRLEGDYYHVDVTWDDPVTEDGTTIRYDYFNITDEEIRQDHAWEEEVYPACTAVRFNFFYYNKLVCKSPREFSEAVRNALLKKQKELNVKIAHYNAQDYSVVSAVNRVIADNPSLSHQGYGYYLPENTRIGVIRIKFN